MARTNNEISVNKGVLDSAANMVKLGIRWMTEKDSLSAGDTEATAGCTRCGCRSRIESGKGNSGSDSNKAVGGIPGIAFHRGCIGTERVL